jgi:hypothetical protein
MKCMLLAGAARLLCMLGAVNVCMAVMKAAACTERPALLAVMAGGPML